MTNKELAAQCLIEAAELLEESAGRNGATDREYATKRLNRLKNGEPDEYARFHDQLHGGREQRIKDLEKEVRTGKTYYKGEPFRKGKEYLDKRSERQFLGRLLDRSVDFNSYISKNPNLHKLINQNAEVAEARKKLAAAKDEFDRKKRENDKLHKAVKNESVDIDALLEEAMDLLDY